MKYFFYLLILLCTSQVSLKAQIPSVKIQTNLPRQMKAGEKMEMNVLLTSKHTSDITGTITVAFTDSKTKKSVDGWVLNMYPFQYFTIEPGKPFTALFPFQVPHAFKNNMDCRIKIVYGKQTDSLTKNILIQPLKHIK